MNSELNELVSAYFAERQRKQEWLQTYSRRMSSPARLFWRWYYRAKRIWIRNGWGYNGSSSCCDYILSHIIRIR